MSVVAVPGHVGGHTGMDWTDNSVTELKAKNQNARRTTVPLTMEELKAKAQIRNDIEWMDPESAQQLYDLELETLAHGIWRREEQFFAVDSRGEDCISFLNDALAGTFHVDETQARKHTLLLCPKCAKKRDSCIVSDSAAAKGSVESFLVALNVFCLPTQG
jgi:hypothetical protein